MPPRKRPNVITPNVKRLASPPPPAAAPAPSSAAATSSSSALKLPFGATSIKDMTPQQKFAFLIPKLLRFSVLGLALWQFWPKLTGKEPWWQAIEMAPPGKVFGRYEPIVADLDKRRRIEEAFEWSWGTYEDNAFGADEYNALSRSGHNLTEAGGVG